MASLTIETRQGLLHQPLPAQDGEVACGFQPFVVLSHSLSWGRHRDQVADAMIEAHELKLKTMCK